MRSRKRLGAPIGKRLREARERAGLSQRALGILAGLDESVASPRVNQYERGTHEPSFRTVQQLAEPLNIPAAYFYADEDGLAAAILKYAETHKK